MILFDSDLVIGKVRDSIRDGLSASGLYVVGLVPGDPILTHAPLPYASAYEEIKAAAEGLYDAVADMVRIAGGLVPYAVVMAAPDLNEVARTAMLDDVLDVLGGDDDEFPVPVIALHTDDPRAGGQVFQRTGHPEIIAADALAARALIAELSPTADHLAPILPIIDTDGIEPLPPGIDVQDVCDTLLGIVLSAPLVGETVLSDEEIEFLAALLKSPLSGSLIAVFAARSLLVPGLVSVLTNLARRTAGPVAASAAGYAILPQVGEDTRADDEGLTDLIDLAVRSGRGTATPPLRLAYRALAGGVHQSTAATFWRTGEAAEHGLRASGIDPFRSV